MKEYYSQSVKQCLIEFETSQKGLSALLAKERRLEAEKYKIKPQKRQSFFKKFLTQIKDLMVVVLLVSSVLSIVVGLIEKSSGEIVDGLIILGIVFVNATFGALQERKSEKAIESLKNMTHPETYVVRDGRVEKISTEDLVLGDIVRLSAGCIVPADLRIVECSNFKVNESMLTGESHAVEKTCEELHGKNIVLAEQKNMAFSGSVVESGNATGVVVALGTQTELGKIAQSIKETKVEQTPLQKDIQKVGKFLTYAILLIAGITFVLEIISNPNSVLQAFLTAVAISVAAIPESLPAVITIIMSLGIAKLSKQKAIVKNMHAVETLGACDVICSDKTGTITQNKMKVEKVFCFDKNCIPNKFFVYNMALCNNAQQGKSGYIGSATEIALLDFARKNHVLKEETESVFCRVKENPFSSERKMMSTLNVVDGEMVCFVKGALDKILQRCTFYARDGKVFNLDENTKQKIILQNKIMCSHALRVMAFAYKKCQDIEEENLIFQGICGIFDPPRKEIFDAVETCKKAGMRPIMITGDFKDTALAVARKVGIASEESQVVSGRELDLVSDEELGELVKVKNVFARVSPTHKARIVQALKKNGHVVAMTGDGVNDAPSMKKADIGIGMGKSGTDVTKDVADILITDDNFATIVVAVREGRKIYSNIQKTIKYLFSANMAEILALFFITIFLPGKTFLLPAQILFVNLITDTLPAVALGTEPVEKNIMTQRARDKNRGLLSGRNGVSIFVLGFAQTILTMTAYFVGLKLQGESVAMTMGFYTLNLLQLFFMFTARTKECCFKTNPFKNKFLNFSLIFGFGMLLFLATTNFGKILSLENLSPFCWFIVFVLSVSIVFIGEVYKLIEKRCLKKKLHFE